MLAHRHSWRHLCCIHLQNNSEGKREVRGGQGRRGRRGEIGEEGEKGEKAEELPGIQDLIDSQRNVLKVFQQVPFVYNPSK